MKPTVSAAVSADLKPEPVLSLRKGSPLSDASPRISSALAEHATSARFEVPAPSFTADAHRDAGAIEDMALLREYAESGSQTAFQKIVDKHIDWVYSTCHRSVRDKHLAEDVTQAVFIILARKARTIAPGTLLTGWLFKTCRYAASDAMKRRARYKKHTERAARLAPPEEALTEQESAWDEMAPHLDEAVACLGDKDKQAILLRFYENKSLRDIGIVMGTTEEAAKKRVARAVEKLRAVFDRQGLKVPTLVLFTSLLLTRTIEAAPPQLAINTTNTATGYAMPSGVSASIAGGATKMMAAATGRLLAALAACAAVAMVAGSSALLYQFESQSSADNTAVVRITDNARPKVDYNRFKHVWIGASDKILWHGQPETLDQQLINAPIDDGTQRSKLYAVAVDHDGQVWARKLTKDQIDLLDATAIVPMTTGGDFDRHARARAIVTTLLGPEPKPVGLVNGESKRSKAEAAAYAAGNASSDDANAAPRSLRRNELPNHRWQSVPGAVRKGDGDGTGFIVIDDVNLPLEGGGFRVQHELEMELQMDLDGRGTGEFNTFLVNSVAVPEPGTLSLLAIACAALLARRRRN